VEESSIGHPVRLKWNNFSCRVFTRNIGMGESCLSVNTLTGWLPATNKPCHVTPVTALNGAVWDEWSIGPLHEILTLSVVVSIWGVYEIIVP